MSESWEFFKPAQERRTLYAKPDRIREAKAALDANKTGILSVEAAEPRTFLGEDYHRVRVVDRPGVEGAGRETSALGPEKGPKGSAAKTDPMGRGAGAPFDVALRWLAQQERKTVREVMLGLQQDQSINGAFRPLTYAHGALSAIKIQLGLKITEQFATEDATKRRVSGHEIAGLKMYLQNWRGEIALVNSEPAHRFEFMVTECGGFSQFVMGGPSKGQAAATVGDRLGMKGLDPLPGPWQNHYAGVLMVDRGDKVTLESAAGMTDWWFGMYGDQRADQTFIVKTLLTKLDIGAANHEPLAAESAAYVRAKVGGDDAAAGKVAPLLGRKQAVLDALIGDARGVFAARVTATLTDIAKA